MNTTYQVKHVVIKTYNIDGNVIAVDDQRIMTTYKDVCKQLGIEFTNGYSKLYKRVLKHKANGTAFITNITKAIKEVATNDK